MDALARKIHRDNKAQAKAERAAEEERSRSLREAQQKSAQVLAPLLRELKREISAALARLEKSPEHKTRLGESPIWAWSPVSGFWSRVYAWFLITTDDGAFRDGESEGHPVYLTTTGDILYAYREADLWRLDYILGDLRADTIRVQTLIEAVKAL